MTCDLRPRTWLSSEPSTSTYVRSVGARSEPDALLTASSWPSGRHDKLPATAASPLQSVPHRHRSLALAGCGRTFSDAQVTDGERLVSNDLYAVVVPEAAEQSSNSRDQISVAWSAAGGRVMATVE